MTYLVAIPPLISPLLSVQSSFLPSLGVRVEASLLRWDTYLVSSVISFADLSSVPQRSQLADCICLQQVSADAVAVRFR